MTNIEIIMAIGLLIALASTCLSIVAYMMLKSEVKKYQTEAEALTIAYKALEKSYGNTQEALEKLHKLIADVLEHDREIIADNATITVDMTRLRAETEALHDSIRKGFEYDGIGSDSEPDE